MPGAPPRRSSGADTTAVGWGPTALVPRWTDKKELSEHLRGHRNVGRHQTAPWNWRLSLRSSQGINRQAAKRPPPGRAKGIGVAFGDAERCVRRPVPSRTDQETILGAHLAAARQFTTVPERINRQGRQGRHGRQGGFGFAFGDAQRRVRRRQCLRSPHQSKLLSLGWRSWRSWRPWRFNPRFGRRPTYPGSRRVTCRTTPGSPRRRIWRFNPPLRAVQSGVWRGGTGIAPNQ
jgi:hypothetical protein